MLRTIILISLVLVVANLLGNSTAGTQITLALMFVLLGGLSFLVERKLPSDFLRNLLLITLGPALVIFISTQILYWLRETSTPLVPTILIMITIILIYGCKTFSNLNKRRESVKRHSLSWPQEWPFEPPCLGSNDWARKTDS
jgi:hypothetical protein